MAIKWRGHKRLRKQAELDWDFQGSKTVVGISYVGPYAQCLASRPAHGSELADMSGYRVTNSKVRRQAAGIGRLTITAESSSAEVGTGDNNDATSTQLEKESGQLEKPVKQHPMYATGGSKVLSDDDWAAIERWENETDQTIRKLFKYRPRPEADPTFLYTLSDNAKHLAARLLKGRDSYLLFQPVLRKTTNHPREPETGDCATTGAPTGFARLPQRKTEGGTSVDYVWIKTADRATNSGENNTWQRMQEWTGFDEVDTDFYPAG